MFQRLFNRQTTTESWVQDQNWWMNSKIKSLFSSIFEAMNLVKPFWQNLHKYVFCLYGSCSFQSSWQDMNITQLFSLPICFLTLSPLSSNYFFIISGLMCYYVRSVNMAVHRKNNRFDFFFNCCTPRFSRENL